MKHWIRGICIGGGQSFWIFGAVFALLSLGDKTPRNDLFGWIAVIGSIIGYYIYQDSKEWE